METEQKKLRSYITESMLISESGIIDLCPLYKNRGYMDELIAWLVEPYRGVVDYVVAPESMGFVLGSMVADSLGVGFIPLRNGHSSFLEEEDSIRASYIDHRDSVRSLHMRRSNFPENSLVLLVDDWIGTSATLQASTTILEEAGGHLQGVLSLGVDLNDTTEILIKNGTVRCVYIRE